MMAMLLRSFGHGVRAANDGLEAVRQAGEFAPDAIILDIGMPRLNGYEACRRIRARPGLWRGCIWRERTRSWATR
jgi:CheY-like chemotaxis protein